jgi:hypothetical protein
MCCSDLRVERSTFRFIARVPITTTSADRTTSEMSVLSSMPMCGTTSSMNRRFEPTSRPSSTSLSQIWIWHPSPKSRLMKCTSGPSRKSSVPFLKLKPRTSTFFVFVYRVEGRKKHVLPAISRLKALTVLRFQHFQYERSWSNCCLFGRVSCGNHVLCNSARVETQD